MKAVDRLLIHHIDWDPSNPARDNLIVVCHSCHSRIHGQEWPEDYFGLPSGREPYPRRQLLRKTGFRCQVCGRKYVSTKQKVVTKFVCACCKRRFTQLRSRRKYDLCPDCDYYFRGKLTGLCTYCGRPTQSRDIKTNLNGKEVWIHRYCPRHL